MARAGCVSADAVVDQLGLERVDEALGQGVRLRRQLRLIRRLGSDLSV